MNIIGDGRSLIQIEAPIADCIFMNGIYNGSGDKLINYNIDKAETKNVVLHNLIKTH